MTTPGVLHSLGAGLRGKTAWWAGLCCLFAKNLQTALVLRAKLPAAFISVRTFDRSAFTRRVEKDQGIFVVYAADELKDRVARDWLPRLGL